MDNERAHSSCDTLASQSICCTFSQNLDDAGGNTILELDSEMRGDDVGVKTYYIHFFPSNDIRVPYAGPKNDKFGESPTMLHCCVGVKSRIQPTDTAREAEET